MIYNIKNYKVVHPAYHVLNEMTKIFYSLMHYLIIKIMHKICRQIKSMSQTGTKLSAMGPSSMPLSAQKE